MAELGLLVAGALADGGETRAELAAAAVDAVAWTDCGDRLLEACGRLDLEPGGIRLPTMRRRDLEERWARLDQVYDWPDDDFQQIDRAWMVRTCDLPMLPRRLGERRVEAVAALAAAANLTLEADPSSWAAWAPALAADLANRRKLVRSDWEAFYADLAQMPEVLEHLQGAAIFRLEDGSLEAANRREGERERELFISPSAEGATGRSRRLGSAPLPPESVARRMVFADPGLSWPPAIAAAYIKAGLATRYDLPRVLARLKHLLGSRPRQASVVAALGWAFIAWRDHRTPEVEQAVKLAGLSVPLAEGGTKPARSAYFSAGWRDTRGELLAEFLALAPDMVRSVKQLRDGLLPDWEAWPLRERGSLADWVQFLKLLGVRDGPGVVYHSAVSRPIWEWVQLRHIDEATLQNEARIGPNWRAALRTDAPWAGIRYQSRNYTTGETLFVLPGHHRPFVADQAEDAAETAAFDMDRLRGGQVHMTRSFKSASLAGRVGSHSWCRSHFQTGAERMKILHIDASASDLATSHTRRLSKQLVEQLEAANPGATVVYRDLVVDQLPHIDLTIRQAWAAENSDDPELAKTMTRSKTLVDELKAADVVVIGSPMYNFTVPSTLKAWIDHVAIAGQTFSYTAEGPRGLLSGKAYFVLSPPAR